MDSRCQIPHETTRNRYATLRYLGEQHIQDCVRVVQSAHLALPAPGQ